MSFLSNTADDANDLGFFATPAALAAAYPVGIPGVFAIVGTTNTFWIWDSGTSAWVNSGSSSTNYVENEVVSGSNVTFVLAHAPVAGSVKLFGNGQRLTSGAGNDYTISGANISIIQNGASYLAGSIIADYRI